MINVNFKIKAMIRIVHLGATKMLKPNLVLGIFNVPLNNIPSILLKESINKQSIKSVLLYCREAFSTFTLKYVEKI